MGILKHGPGNRNLIRLVGTAPMNNKPFVILGAGVDSVEIIKRVAQDYPVIAIDENPSAPGFAFATKPVVFSCYERGANLALLDLAPLAGVLCGGVDAPLVQCAIAEVHGLVGPSRRTAGLSADKLAQQSTLSAWGVKTPKTRIARGPADLLGLTSKYIVVKPSDNRGARGVVRGIAHNMGEAEAHKLWGMANEHAKWGEALVQEWVEGEQLSTESLVQNGKVLWTSIARRNYDRLEEFAPHVIEDGSDIPWEPHYGGNGHSPEDKVTEALQLCVRAIGLENGTLKGDLVWDGTVTVIEVACRLSGGGFCSVLTPKAWGVDFVGLAMKIALGEQIEVPRPVLQQSVRQRFEFRGKPTCHPERGPWHLE